MVNEAFPGSGDFEFTNPHLGESAPMDFSKYIVGRPGNQRHDYPEYAEQSFSDKSGTFPRIGKIFGYYDDTTPTETTPLPPVDPELAAKGAASIAADAESYIVLRKKLQEQDAEERTPAPDDAHFYYNTDNNPLSAYYIKIRTVQSLGYNVRTTEDAIDLAGLPRPELVAIRIGAEDALSVKKILSSTSTCNSLSNSNRGLCELLRRATNYQAATAMSYDVFDPDDYERQAIEETFQEAPEVQNMDSLLGPAFMTSQVLQATEEAINPPRYDYEHPSDKERNHAKYQELKAQGVRPFNIEQLYGMASSVVLAAIRENNIPPPANPPAPKGQPFTAGRAPEPGADDYYPY